MPRQDRPLANRTPARFVFVAVSLAALTLALVPHPPRLMAWDKAEHFVGGALIALLALPALPGLAMGWLISGLAVSAAAVEVLQAVAGTGRSGDPADWLAGVLGAILALGLCHLAAPLTAYVRSPPRKASD